MVPKAGPKSPKALFYYNVLHILLKRAKHMITHYNYISQYQLLILIRNFILSYV